MKEVAVAAYLKNFILNFLDIANYEPRVLGFTAIKSVCFNYICIIMPYNVLYNCKSAILTGKQHAA